MNKISPKKLFNSKWTAITACNKEKHFVVVNVKYDEDQTVVECVFQAIMSKRNTYIQWRELNNPQKWVQGWK